MAPPPYSDIGRRVKDLFTKDYNFDQKFTLTMIRDTGLGLTACGVKRDHYFVGNLSTQYRSPYTTVNVKIDTDSNISTTVMVNEILSHTKAAISFNIPDHKAGKLYVQYQHPHAIINSHIGLTPTPFLEIAAAIGSKELCFGGEIGFDTATASITKCNTGIGLNKPDFSAALMLVDKGEALKASYIHEMNPINRATVAAEITHRLSTNENSFIIGSSYALNPRTVIKTRFSDDGKIAMACQREWRPNSLLTFSAEYNSKNTRVFWSQIIELDKILQLLTAVTQISPSEEVTSSGLLCVELETKSSLCNSRKKPQKNRPLLGLSILGAPSAAALATATAIATVLRVGMGGGTCTGTMMSVDKGSNAKSNFRCAREE